jgi:hypothetical protein
MKEIIVNGAKCLVLVDELENEHSPYYLDTEANRKYLQYILNSIPKDCCG